MPRTIVRVMDVGAIARPWRSDRRPAVAGPVVRRRSNRRLRRPPDDQRSRAGCTGARCWKTPISAVRASWPLCSTTSRAAVVSLTRNWRVARLRGRQASHLLRNRGDTQAWSRSRRSPLVQGGSCSSAAGASALRGRARVRPFAEGRVPAHQQAVGRLDLVGAARRRATWSLASSGSRASLVRCPQPLRRGSSQEHDGPGPYRTTPSRAASWSSVGTLRLHSCVSPGATASIKALAGADIQYEPRDQEGPWRCGRPGIVPQGSRRAKS